MKKLIASILFSAFIVLAAPPVQADDETAKALIGSVIGVIATEAMKESTATQGVKEDIQWNTPRPTINENISSVSPEEVQRNKEIQARLTRIGFYTGEIDGIAGSVTEQSIIIWETEFEQSQDGIIDDHEFYYLDELVNGGFTNKADYDLAKQGGYKTRKEYLAATQSVTAPQSGAVPDNTASVATSTTELSKENADTNAAPMQTDEKEMPKLLKVTIWFAVFFGFFILIALIKGVVEQGNEYGLRLILSPQFFIILLGLPFAFYVGGDAFFGNNQEFDNPLYNLLLLAAVMMIPIMVSYIMNARASSYGFAVPYTFIQILSIPFLILVIAFVKAQKDAYNEKKGYR